MWRPKAHAAFGPAFNRAAAALLLGMRRLAAAGAAPDMDPAVLEETLGFAGLLGTPLPLASCSGARRARIVDGHTAMIALDAADVPGHTPFATIRSRTPARAFVVDVAGVTRLASDEPTTDRISIAIGFLDCCGDFHISWEVSSLLDGEVSSLLDGGRMRLAVEWAPGATPLIHRFTDDGRAVAAQPPETRRAPARAATFQSKCYPYVCTIMCATATVSLYEM